MGASFSHASSTTPSVFKMFDGAAPTSGGTAPPENAEPVDSGRIATLPSEVGVAAAVLVADQTTIDGSECLSAPLGGRTKRVLDVVVATMVLAIAWPLMLLVAVLIKSSSRGRVLFVHRRIGFNGRPFDCYKFRTMVDGAETTLAAYLARNPHAAQEWSAAQKIRRDPRITFFGRMLRKSSLDELPQLFNVLSGDMSLVGPRPVVAEELWRYGRFASEYLVAKPGMTGLWQISGRDSLDYSQRVSLDSKYVRTWSFAGDLIILFRTIGAVMRFDQAS